jgi:hypothetical protein
VYRYPTDTEAINFVPSDEEATDVQERLFPAVVCEIQVAPESDEIYNEPLTTAPIILVPSEEHAKAAHDLLPEDVIALQEDPELIDL